MGITYLVYFYCVYKLSRVFVSQPNKLNQIKPNIFGISTCGAGYGKHNYKYMYLMIRKRMFSDVFVFVCRDSGKQVYLGTDWLTDSTLCVSGYYYLFKESIFVLYLVLLCMVITDLCFWMFGLGGFDTAHSAARYILVYFIDKISTSILWSTLDMLMNHFLQCDYRAYDQAAIKFRGVDADINFKISDYEDSMKQVNSY